MNTGGSGTERRQEKLHDSFLVQLDDATRTLSDPAEITHTAVKMLCEHLEADRCSYAEIDVAARQVDVLGAYSTTLPGIIGRYPIPSFGPEFLSRMSQGQTHIFRDASRELEPDAAAAYRAINITAIVAVPIIKQGRLVAGLGLHQSTPRDWRPDEIQLVEKVANRCWESIERGRVERALRASEEQFRTLADTIPNLAWMARPDGHVFWYNRRWYDYTGSSPEQGTGWDSPHLHAPETLLRVVEQWRQSVSSGEPFEMVFPLRAANGQHRSFLTRIEPIKDDAERVLRWFGTGTDVTAQQEAQEKEARLRQTAEFLNELAPELLAELDEQVLAQRITEIATDAVGAEFGAFLRFAPTKAANTMSVYAVSGIDASKLEPVLQTCGLLSELLQNPQDWRCGGVDPVPAGSETSAFPLRTYLIVPIKSRPGDVDSALMFGHSHSEVFSEQAQLIARGISVQAAIAIDNARLFDRMKRSAEAQKQMNEELTRANDDLKQFAYSASHDLREPLRMVSLYSELLGAALEGRLNENESQYLAFVLTGATRTEAMIRDLLSYTQVSASSEADTVRCDANEALAQALTNLSTAVKENGAQIYYPVLPAVRIPDVQLIQVFQNLIGNALKYRSQEVPVITISVQRESDQWVFSVADNGIGIKEDYKHQIFGLFKRLHSRSQYSGTGIGLALCQRIIQRVGGRIWVESSPGSGSTFYFTLRAA